MTGENVTEEIIVGGVKLESRFEAVFANILLDNGISFKHENSVFNLYNDNHHYQLVPDFTTDISVRMGDIEKRVLFETHASLWLDDKYINKLMCFFKSDYAKSNYLVIITDIYDSNAENLIRQLRKYEQEVGEHRGEVWIIPYYKIDPHIYSGEISKLLKEIRRGQMHEEVHVAGLV